MSTAARRVPLWLGIVAVVLAGAAVVLLAVDLSRRESSNGSKSHGSGVAVTETRTLAPFTRIELAGGNNVHIAVGGPQSVLVHGDDNLVKRVETAVRDGALVISTRGTFQTHAPMSVDVRVPSLSALTLSGSGNVDARGVAARSLAVSLPGSGNLSVTGTAGTLDATLDGSGNEFLFALRAERARADMAGSGNIFVDVARSLDASISGSGTIVYHGNPAVTQRVSGSGAVTPG
jgi:Putative auto-transporter adhesin, head GIN domain